MIWWERLNKKSNYMRDCAISDIRVQSLIETMGGWVWFCTRLVRDETGKELDVWNQKRFIELYKLYTGNPPEKEFKILRGDSTFSAEKRQEKMVFIGDEDKCRLMIIGNNVNPVMKEISDMTIKMKEWRDEL